MITLVGTDGNPVQIAADSLNISGISLVPLSTCAVEAGRYTSTHFLSFE